MSKPALRPATPADIAAITAIYRPAVLTGTASFELEPPGEDEMLRRFRAIAEAGYPYVVAELDGRIAGYAYVNAYRTRPGYRFTVENSVYVAPDSQGRGFGRALLPPLIERCEHAGFRLMVAVIGDSANQASIRLHEGCGFRHAGLLPAIGWKHGRWLDSVLMVRPLGPGASDPPPPGMRSEVPRRLCSGLPH